MRRSVDSSQRAFLLCLSSKNSMVIGEDVVDRAVARWRDTVKCVIRLVGVLVLPEQWVVCPPCMLDGGRVCVLPDGRFPRRLRFHDDDLGDELINNLNRSSHVLASAGYGCTCIQPERHGRPVEPRSPVLSAETKTCADHLHGDAKFLPILNPHS